MTRHNLVPLGPTEFARLVLQRPEVAANRITDNLPRWLANTRSRAVNVIGWREPAPKPWSRRQLVCCLETERGANGSLAHLSATFERSVQNSVGQHLEQMLLDKWSARRLAELRVLALESLSRSRAA